MKKKIIAMFAVLAVACLVLVGCGGAGSDPKAAWVGTRKLSGMVENGEEMSADDLKALESLGLEVTMTLSEDGKASLSLFGEAMDGTWEAKSATEGTFTAQGSSAPMKIENEVLSMEQNGSKLSFSKSAAADAATSSATSDAAATSAADATSATSAA